MIEDKKVIGIIPARGNSKGVPKKNIKPLSGTPLIGWTIKEARKSKYIDKLILSSDNQEIISVAKRYGLEAPFLRPSELAQDDTIPTEVIIHALKKCPGFDLIVVLQPTSPFRKAEDIDGAIWKVVDSGAPACVSVTLPDKSPYWMFGIDQKERLTSLFPDKPLAANRQEQPLVYALNGAVFVANVKFLLEQRSFICPETVGYVMPRSRSIDIDDEMDFLLAKALIEK
jgi:N-acylneuraminate cytidylyltransferase